MPDCAPRGALLRNYLGASIIDDVGIAVSGWASMLLLTNLFTDQRERAKLVIPSLLCFLAGSVIAGPLADWARGSLAKLARYRHRLALAARGLETVFLGVLVVSIAQGPTLERVLPYVMVSAFLKTALRPARAAFEVDLLRQETPLFGPGPRPARTGGGRWLAQGRPSRTARPRGGAPGPTRRAARPPGRSRARGGP